MKSRLGVFALFVGLVLLVSPACAKSGPQNTAVQPSDVSVSEQAAEGGEGMGMQLSSPSFKHGERIPKKYTGDGQNVSPPLEWKNAPALTKSFAVICDDPDAPVGIWVHWVIFNIPGSSNQLPEAVPPQKELPNGAKQGINDFRKTGYGGPAPPPGKPHRYFFRLYALDVVLDLKADVKKSDLLKAMEGHILATAELMGTYQR